MESLKKNQESIYKFLINQTNQLKQLMKSLRSIQSLESLVDLDSTLNQMNNFIEETKQIYDITSDNMYPELHKPLKRLLHEFKKLDPKEVLEKLNEIGRAHV